MSEHKTRHENHTNESRQLLHCSVTDTCGSRQLPDEDVKQWRLNTAVCLASFTLTSSYSFLLSACRIIDLEPRKTAITIKLYLRNTPALLSLLDEDCIRFAGRGGDLKTVASVLALHGHDGAVVQVQHHAPRHRPARLAHQVPSLGEEVQSVPGRGHQTCFTGARRRRRWIQVSNAECEFTK